MKINVTLRSAGLDRYLDATGGSRRAELMAAMGTEVQITTENYLRDLAANRHATAERLGAAATGFLGQAAEQVSSPAALSVDADAAVLTIRSPGIARAFHPITIRPINCTYLAIPLNALAYGRRPAEFRASGEKVKLIIKDGHRTGREEPRTKKNDEEKAAPQDVAAFVLVRSVTQQQDRTLLPSDEAWQKAARTGAENFIHALP